MTSRDVIPGGAGALRVFLCFAAAYLLSYAFRSINAVIAPSLIVELSLSNAELGFLSSAYFVSFGALQLPLGIWLDKYGARKTEAALLLFAALGAVIFATSTSLPGLWLGRALIGAGVSACLMAPFKGYRMWYARDRQSQLASWMLVAGTFGALVATVPVTAALPLIGWRGVFWLMAALILLAALAIFILLRDTETAHLRRLEQSAAPANAPDGDSAKNGYARVFGDPYFRRLALLGLVNHGTFIALQTLWAGPWMTTVLGMSEEQTARILFAFNLCLLLSYVALGWLAPRYISHHHRRAWSVEKAVTVGLSGTLLTYAAIVTVTASWAWMLWIVLAAFATVTTLIQARVNLSFPSDLAGRANGAYNLLMFIGAFTVQWGVGILIDAFEAHGVSSSQAMRAAFAVCLAAQAAALLAFVLNRASVKIVNI